MDLLIIFITSILLIPLAVFTDGVVRVVLGLFFILFFPGYTLMAALFPKKTGMEAITRLTLSLGMSMVLVVIILLLLNFTPWGFHLYPTLITIFLFTGTMATIAWRRRKQFAPEERFDPGLNLKLADVSRFWTEKSHPDKALTALLIVTIIGVIGTLGFVTVKPTAGEQYTEFYLLDLENKAEYYPSELDLGEEGQVIICIINQERETAIYNVEIVLDGEKMNEIGPINLDQEEIWEQGITFTPTRVGDDQKVEFLLYKDNQQLYRTLHIWIDVNGEVT